MPTREHRLSILAAFAEWFKEHPEAQLLWPVKELTREEVEELYGKQEREVE